MSAAHTPGPWKVRKEWHGDGKEVYPDRKVLVGQPAEVCVVSGIYDECAANARLIAAAPTMLAEMRRYLPLLERLEDSPLWAELTAGLGIATINGYRAAISKATGSQE